ncbi:hypothetical protein DFH11DRAFT_1722044 [Phellopilus nigrolimitatus]|nr:hypothetical protein DFH11DRAFT_1722044 [Phellopilus nigrolimitatus]
MASADAPAKPESLDFYEPKPTINAVQNALGTHNKGAMGVFTRTGGTIGFFAAVGATFAATEAIVANTREKKDPWNGAAGGCAAGFLAGLRVHSLPIAVASCAFMGTAVGTFDASGELAGERRQLGTQEAWEERRKRFFKQKKTAEVPADS